MDDQEGPSDEGALGRDISEPFSMGGLLGGRSKCKGLDGNCARHIRAAAGASRVKW